MSEQEQLKKFLLEDMTRNHNETRKTLDELRRTRVARGGVGAPLQVPTHLRDAAAGIGIIVTDADLNPDLMRPVNPRLMKEQTLDELSDTVRDIEEIEGLDG